MICESGKTCPASGIWEIIGSFTTTALIKKNNEMPEYCGKKVLWRLLIAC